MAPTDGERLYRGLISLVMSVAVSFFEQHPHNIADTSVTLGPKQREDCPEGEEMEHALTFSTVT